MLPFRERTELKGIRICKGSNVLFAAISYRHKLRSPFAEPDTSPQGNAHVSEKNFCIAQRENNTIQANSVPVRYEGVILDQHYTSLYLILISPTDIKRFRIDPTLTRIRKLFQPALFRDPDSGTSCVALLFVERPFRLREHIYQGRLPNCS